MSDFLDVDLNVPRFRLSLRITGDTLDPDFLSQQLGMAPTFSAAKGDANPRWRDGETHPTGVWVYRIDVPPDTELGEAIQSLLGRLPASATLWSEITSSFRVDVFCGVFLRADNQSTTVDPEVLGALHHRGFSLLFDLYSPGSGGGGGSPD